MDPEDPAVPPSLRRSSIFLGVIAVLAACEPNVLIGAKYNHDGDGLGGQVGVSGSASFGGSVSGSPAGGVDMGGSETGDAGEGGAAGAGMAGAAGGAGMPAQEWCATSAVLNEPRKFESTSGDDHVIPAGDYIVKYMSGAQLHDPNIGWEVTGHYTGMNMLKAGIHIYSGESVETGATSLWLDATGLITAKTVAEVEEKNAGHTWPLTQVESAELWVVLYDDIYTDNKGTDNSINGVHYCIVPAP